MIRYGVTQQPGILLFINSAATTALDFPMSDGLMPQSGHENQKKIKRTCSPSKQVPIYAYCIPEEKLSVKVREVNSVHVNTMDLCKSK